MKIKKGNIFLGASLLIGVLIGIVSMVSLPLISGMFEDRSHPPKASSALTEAEVKKQALSRYYKEISAAEKKKDWVKLYDLVPQSVRNNVTKEQFVAHVKEEAEKNKIVSQKYTIHSIVVNGNNGAVERTIITCLAKECTGENRKEDKAKKQYEFVDENWQIPDPEPSERALKAANYGFQMSTSSDQKDLIDWFGYGSDTTTYTIRNWAVYLDKNLEELIRVETLVEQNKAEKSRPVVNYQPPATVRQPGIIVQPPAVQQPNYPKNCTSNTIGSYAYTNCY